MLHFRICIVQVYCKLSATSPFQISLPLAELPKIASGIEEETGPWDHIFLRLPYLQSTCRSHPPNDWQVV
jgi:hypothetical protein